MLYFNDTITGRGIIQEIERILFPNQTGTISGNAQLLSDFTAEINLARDQYTGLIQQVGGLGAPEDFTHTDLPIISTDITSGVRSYTFNQDSSGNNILDIYKLVVYDTNGYGTELQPIEVRQNDQTGSLNWIADFYNGQNLTGLSTFYARTANTITLGYTPNYSTNGAVTGKYGLTAYISREPDYYLSTDTMKLSGFPGLYDRYLAIVPAQRFAANNGMAVAGGVMRNGARTGLLGDIQETEAAIQKYYGRRLRDVPTGMRARQQDNH